MRNAQVSDQQIPERTSNASAPSPPVGKELALGMDAFATEVRAVRAALVRPSDGAGQEGRVFPHSLYSYAHGLFARVDLLSAYWRGSARDRVERMVAFLDEYFPYEPEAHSVAAQVWRHQAMPTGEPHGLYDRGTGRSYLWVLYWGEDLPPGEHFRFHEATGSRILSLGLTYLTEDVSRASEGYFRDLESSPALQDNYRQMETRMASRMYRRLG